jgi:hypothetical protein
MSTVGFTDIDLSGGLPTLGSASTATPYSLLNHPVGGLRNNSADGGAMNNPGAASAGRNNNNNNRGRNRKGKDTEGQSREASKERSPDQPGPGIFGRYNYYEQQLTIDPKELASALRGVIPRQPILSASIIRIKVFDSYNIISFLEEINEVKEEYRLSGDEIYTKICRFSEREVAE